ncbi:MAG: PaaI family thioesterase [Paludibacteraceae bacterium]
MRKLSNPYMHTEGYNCFGCAPHNPAGVHMEFYEDGDEIVSVWRPQPQFQSWINTLHGGIQAVLLDEICGWVMFRKLERSGVTSKMETRYRHPVTIDSPYVVLRASLVEQKRNIAIIKATIVDAAGKLCTEAVCTYFTFTMQVPENMTIKHCVPIGDDMTLEEIVKNI